MSKPNYKVGDEIVLLSWNNAVTRVQQLKDGELYFTVPGYKGAYMLKHFLDQIKLRNNEESTRAGRKPIWPSANQD